MKYLWLTLTLAFATLSQAQGTPSFDPSPKVGIMGMLAIPVGGFASPTNGTAEIGGGVGVDLLYPLNPSLSVGAEAWGIYNPLDHQTVESELEAENGGDPVTVTGGNYSDIPVLVKLAYTAPIGPSCSFSLEGGVGVDITYISHVTFTEDGNEGTEAISTDPALAVSVAGKFNIRNFFLGMEFMNLGDHTANSVTTFEGQTQANSSDQQISLLTLLAGIRF